MAAWGEEGPAMIGGHVQQRIGNRIEVLCPTYFDRAWRTVEPAADVIEGDYIWWQSFTGYRTRDDCVDVPIGECKPARPPAEDPAPDA